MQQLTLLRQAFSTNQTSPALVHKAMVVGSSGIHRWCPVFVYFVVLCSCPSLLIDGSKPQRPEDTKSNLAIRPSFPYILCLTIATQNPEAMLLRSALGEESTWLATTTRFVTLFLGRAARCDRTQQYASSENAGRMLTCPARFRDGFGRTISKRLHVGDETTKAQCTQSQAATEFAQSIRPNRELSD